MSTVSIGKIAQALGVCVMTIRRWHAAGSLIPDFMTKGGHRRYDMNRVKTIFQPIKDERLTIGYCRVSSADQLSDLETQKIVSERESAPQKNSIIICDRGSGINFKKRGLLELLKRIMTGEVREVIITHKDRLVRFGFELIERIANEFGAKITILNREEKEPPFEEELAKDLITIITVFSSHLYGNQQ